MKLSTKKWFGMPAVLVAVVLAVVLLAGGAFAAYTFTGLSVEVAVDEPLQVQYKITFMGAYEDAPVLVDLGWQDMPASGLEAFFSAGDSQVLYFRFNNRANNDLQVDTVISGDPPGNFAYTIGEVAGDFPLNLVIPASTGWDFHNGDGVSDEDAAELSTWPANGADLAIKGDVAPGTYNLTIEFEREDVTQGP